MSGWGTPRYGPESRGGIVGLLVIGVLVVVLAIALVTAMSSTPPKDDVSPRDCGEVSAHCDGQDG